MDRRSANFDIRPAERSFTLLETLIALGIMVFVVMEVGGIQGNAIYFNDYGRRIVTATNLARRLMSEVDYHWRNREFKELEVASVKEQTFEDEPEYLYTVEIKEWKLPIIDMITGGGVGGEGEGEDGEPKEESSGGQGDLVKDGFEKTFGDEILKIARVEVSWPEGARRNSVELTYLLTNQRKVDSVLSEMKAVFDSAGGGGSPSPTPSPTPSPSSPTGGG